MSSNKSLNRAKVKTHDEFYTQLGDIENELRYYSEHFKGKVVYCNCDDPRESKFFHYFLHKFEELGLKKLITTCYKNAAVYLEYNGDKNGSRVPDPDEIDVYSLEGDGDFRSKECIDLLKQADIVVTNPPFSLFREYVAQMIKYKKKFLILGNNNSVQSKEIWPLFEEGKMWLGTSANKSLEFEVPSTYKNTHLNDKGKPCLVVPAISWFTNLDHKKRHEDLILTNTYSSKKYQKYDNYNAIEVPKVMLIPKNWGGVMGVPITFLTKHNPSQFEILGISAKFNSGLKSHKKYDDYVEIGPDGKSTGRPAKRRNGNAMLPGKGNKSCYYINEHGDMAHCLYGRIFIRNRKPEK